MPDKADKALIARAKAGDHAAIGKIFDSYQGQVYRFLHYRLGDQHSAEDLTGEVFLRVIKALPRYQQTRLPFQAWLMKIAHNLAIDHFRRMRHRNHLALHENVIAKSESPETTAERNILGSNLVKALATLTDDQREVILLRIIVEMPIAEVALVLNKSETAIKALQRRGLQALRKTLLEWNITYG